MKLITKLWHIIKTYPISIPFYLIYLSFASLVLSLEIKLKNMHDHHPTLGEGLAYGIFLLAIIGSIFFFITLINLILRIKNRSFYSWLLFFIALPPAIMIFVGSF
jgi:hypothetical protein